MPPREACPPHRNLGQRHRQGRHGRAERDIAPASLSRARPRPPIWQRAARWYRPARRREETVRARQKIADGRASARFDIESAEHRLVTDKFIAACAGGDLDGLLAVLAPDAWGEIDLGPTAAQPRSVVTGAGNVAANLLRYWGPGSTLVSLSAGGQPALLGFHGRALAALLVLRMRGHQVEAVHVIADPAQIGFLSRQLATAAG